MLEATLGPCAEYGVLLAEFRRRGEESVMADAGLCVYRYQTTVGSGNERYTSILVGICSYSYGTVLE